MKGKNRYLLAKQVEALKESVRFYRPGNQWERDRWVVQSLLENCGIQHDPRELVQPDSDPPDAFFRTAKFEVKEVLDKGRRRHAEFKALLQRAQSARSLRELLSVYTPRDIVLSDLLGLCTACSNEQSPKYAREVRRSLDLLIYVNLRHVESIIVDTALSAPVIESHGWRSVSFVKGHSGGCISANTDAPDFLRKLSGVLDHRWRHENERSGR